MGDQVRPWECGRIAPFTISFLILTYTPSFFIRPFGILYWESWLFGIADIIGNTYLPGLCVWLLFQYKLTSFIVSTDHMHVEFCSYISPKVLFRSYTIPTPVLLYFPVRTGNIAYLMSRILFRPQLLPRVAVIRCAPILEHENTTFTTY